MKACYGNTLLLLQAAIPLYTFNLFNIINYVLTQDLFIFPHMRGACPATPPPLPYFLLHDLKFTAA